MAEGAVLKWLSDYRINIQRCSKREEKGITAQRQTKETFLPSAETFDTCLQGCGVTKVQLLSDFEVVTVDCNKVSLSCKVLHVPGCNVSLLVWCFLVFMIDALI